MTTVREASFWRQKVLIPWWVVALLTSVAVIVLGYLSIEEPDSVGAFFTAVMAIATVSLVIAAIRALQQVKEARESRHAVAATDFSRRWDEPDMIKTRALMAKYTDAAMLKADFFDLFDNDPENPNSLQMLKQANYLEDLAILEMTGAVGHNFVKGSLGYIVVSRWKLWRDVADEFQHRHGVDNYPHFRDLAARLEAEGGFA